jgi:predicted RNase H-like nuclease (RuvC/YqgF family)
MILREDDDKCSSNQAHGAPMDPRNIARLQTKLAHYEAKLDNLPSGTPDQRAYLTSIKQTVAQTRRRLREANAEPAEHKPRNTVKRRLLEKLAHTERELQQSRAEIEFLKRTIETLHRNARIEA